MRRLRFLCMIASLLPLSIACVSGCVTIVGQLGKEGIKKIDAHNQHKKLEQRSLELKTLRELCDVSDTKRIPAVAQKSIAILDIKVSGRVPPEKSSAYADVCRNLVEITDRLVLLDGENTVSLLKGSHVEPSRFCSDLPCFESLAVILNVDVVACGTLVEHESLYSIRLFLADKETRRIYVGEVIGVEDTHVELSFVNVFCGLLRDQLRSSELRQ